MNERLRAAEAAVLKTSHHLARLAIEGADLVDRVKAAEEARLGLQREQDVLRGPLDEAREAVREAQVELAGALREAGAAAGTEAACAWRNAREEWP